MGLSTVPRQKALLDCTLTKAIRCLLQSLMNPIAQGTQRIKLIVAQLPFVASVGHADSGGVQSIIARLAGQLIVSQKQHDGIRTSPIFGPQYTAQALSSTIRILPCANTYIH